MKFEIADLNTYMYCHGDDRRLAIREFELCGLHCIFNFHAAFAETSETAQVGDQMS